jgi:hypothetical protein
MKKLDFLILFLLIWGLPNLIFPQDKIITENEISCVEQYFFGSHDLMVNGRVYVPSNQKASGHAYYLFENYQNGTLYIRDLVFDRSEIKYNLVNDQLILRKELPNTTVVEIMITPSLVDSFEIHQKKFINNKSVVGIPNGSNYLQKVYDGKLKLYKRSIKHYYPVFSQSDPFGRFGNEERQFYLVAKNGVVTEINSKRAFLKYFKNQKRAVRKFMKKQRIRFSKITDEQFYNLMNYCDHLE